MGTKRSRSRSPSSYNRPEKVTRASNDWHGARQDKYGRSRNGDNRHDQQQSRKEQTRLNQLQDDEKMREWVAQEDDFVLKQRKKKADIRVKEGRAQPIDKLTVLLRVIDPSRDKLDEDPDEETREIFEPDSVIKGLSLAELTDLGRDIETYLHLETASRNREYWRALLSVCQDYKQMKGTQDPEGRAMSSVATDIDKILSSKTLVELEKLEKDIKQKLRSNEPIDTDYWEQLLKRLLVWKAKASLQRIFQAIKDSRLQKLRVEQENAALQFAMDLKQSLDGNDRYHSAEHSSSELTRLSEQSNIDPEAMLHIRESDKGLEVVDESVFLLNAAAQRTKITSLGHISSDRGMQKKTSLAGPNTRTEAISDQNTLRFAQVPAEDFSQATKALYEKEVARGINEDEEIFTGEESVDTKSKPLWANKYRPRKPRYFNRVQMGYEWNKYNQTHYDHDNPPPKVVQGYKFNIFYPDLIDKIKAPTYKIEREGGRKRGQSFAPAGEEDTCLIRFISGPPYEDIAFRIVDKEWDYSAKRERGFRSSFDKGILQLHFQFKKIYYRK